MWKCILHKMLNVCFMKSYFAYVFWILGSEREVNSLRFYIGFRFENAYFIQSI